MRKASSYCDSFLELNQHFKQDGKPEVELVLVPDALEDEDLLEMRDVGLIELLVVDDWKAYWAQVYPKLRMRNDLVLRANAKTGWGVRKKGHTFIPSHLEPLPIGVNGYSLQFRVAAKAAEFR